MSEHGAFDLFGKGAIQYQVQYIIIIIITVHFFIKT